MARLPLAVPLLAVHGDADDRVPISQSETFVAAAVAAGDRAELVALPGVDHFAVIDPADGSWDGGPPLRRRGGGLTGRGRSGGRSARPDPTPRQRHTGDLVVWGWNVAQHLDRVEIAGIVAACREAASMRTSGAGALLGGFALLLAACWRRRRRGERDSGRDDGAPAGSGAATVDHGGAASTSTATTAAGRAAAPERWPCPAGTPADAVCSRIDVPADWSSPTVPPSRSRWPSCRRPARHGGPTPSWCPPAVRASTGWATPRTTAPRRSEPHATSCSTTSGGPDGPSRRWSARSGTRPGWRTCHATRRSRSSGRRSSTAWRRAGAGWRPPASTSATTTPRPASATSTRSAPRWATTGGTSSASATAPA